MAKQCSIHAELASEVAAASIGFPGLVSSSSEFCPGVAVNELWQKDVGFVTQLWL